MTLQSVHRVPFFCHCVHELLLAPNLAIDGHKLAKFGGMLIATFITFVIVVGGGNITVVSTPSRDQGLIFSKSEMFGCGKITISCNDRGRHSPCNLGISLRIAEFLFEIRQFTTELHNKRFALIRSSARTSDLLWKIDTLGGQSGS